MEFPLRNRLALALDDVPSLKALRELIDATSPWFGVFKIGLELFTRFGPPVCAVVRESKRKLFLDLKLHDIPNTVGKAMDAACDCGADYCTVHALGGVPMMRAAAESRRQKGRGLPKVIGVTLLTSIDAESLGDALKVPLRPDEYTRHLASLAVRAGLDGIVCSAADLLTVKTGLPSGFELITPGIRPAGSAANDQKRIATPKEAVKNGATLLVVGRAVTAAPDPARAAAAIAAETGEQ
jgi:orotidine-5'-phosphate decarboxylase